VAVATSRAVLLRLRSVGRNDLAAGRVVISSDGSLTLGATASGAATFGRGERSGSEEFLSNGTKPGDDDDDDDDKDDEAEARGDAPSPVAGAVLVPLDGCCCCCCCCWSFLSVELESSLCVLSNRRLTRLLLRFVGGTALAPLGSHSEMVLERLPGRDDARCVRPLRSLDARLGGLVCQSSSSLDEELSLESLDTRRSSALSSCPSSSDDPCREFLRITTWRFCCVSESEVVCSSSSDGSPVSVRSVDTPNVDDVEQLIEASASSTDDADAL